MNNTKDSDPKATSSVKITESYQNVINEALNLKEVIVTPPKYLETLTNMCNLITAGKDYTEVLALLTPMKARVLNRGT